MALTKVTGSVIKDSVSLSGNVSVGGTLTYQDVTNVDALGIGTFRTGIKVLAGQVDVGSNIKLGNAGVVTATSFVGSGANLTSLPSQVTISSNADNRVITGGSGTNLVGESTLTYNGLQLNISNTVPELFLTDTNSNNSYGRVRGNGGNLILSADVNNATGGVRVVNFEIGGSEKARITSNGQMGIGDDNPDRELVVKNASSNATVKIEASNSHTSQLFFSDTDAENVARIGVFHGSGQSTSNAMVLETGGTARLMINSSGQLIVNSTSATDAQFTVVGSGHYVVTSSGRAHKHIHCRAVNGNSGEYGGAISFGMGSNGSSAIAAEQMSSDGNVNGLAFFTHPTSNGSDDAVKRMRITNTGGIQLNNYGATRGFIFQRLGAGTYPDFPNVQGSQGRGMCSGQRVVSANTATEIAKSHWGGLALVGYSNSQHQGTAQVMFGYGGAGASVRFSGHWVRQESLTITFTVSAYSLMISHNASNDLSVWCILIGV